ncbi:MAG TPA: hypothetical protein VGP25_13255 [Gemmatimonadaceae bacterium]|jgi:hypothetical protein|nr:hypothetical protein [Gemmatimonadaceae bacterium]
MQRPRSGWRGARRLATLALAIVASSCGARTYEQSYLGARDNWFFRDRYPRADHLFNGFDYGHAILSETLLRHRGDAGQRLDGPVYRFLTCTVLRNPPTVPLEERAVGPTYGARFPEVVATFEWAHLLHRQLYDVIADERLTPDARAARVRAALRYYRSRRDLALSEVPKSMELMEGQRYSLAFRRAAPRFNGLIWAYHWLQMALYDALLEAPDAPSRRTAVARDVERFMRMTTELGAHAPTAMPMSAAIAPEFTRRYPEAAIIFDNLHSLHDVVSDVLASPLVPENRKRAEIALALARYRDSTSFTMTRDEWLTMSREMGALDPAREGPTTPGPNTASPRGDRAVDSSSCDSSTTLGATKP